MRLSCGTMSTLIVACAGVAFAGGNGGPITTHKYKLPEGVTPDDITSASEFKLTFHDVDEGLDNEYPWFFTCYADAGLTHPFAGPPVTSMIPEGGKINPTYAPILDGEGNDNFTWVLNADGIYETTVYCQPSYVGGVSGFPDVTFKMGGKVLIDGLP